MSSLPGDKPIFMSWNKDRDRELREDWASGLTAGQILQKHKWPCSENAINMRARRLRLPPRVRINGGLLPIVTMDDAPLPVIDPRTSFRECLHCRTSFLSQHGGVRACPVCQAYYNQHGAYPESPQSFACYTGNYSGADDDLL